MLRDRCELYAPTRAKAPLDAHPCGRDSGDEVIKDAIDHLLIKGGMIAEGGEVVLEALCLDYRSRRAISNRQVTAIWLPRHRAE